MMVGEGEAVIGVGSPGEGHEVEEAYLGEIAGRGLEEGRMKNTSLIATDLIWLTRRRVKVAPFTRIRQRSIRNQSNCRLVEAEEAKVISPMDIIHLGSTLMDH